MRMLLISTALLACSSSKSNDTKSADPAGSAAAAATTRITDGEHVCDALTEAEVKAEVHADVKMRRLPKAGEYGAPSCGWFDGEDAHNSLGVSVVLFVSESEATAKQYFAEKLETLCKGKQRAVEGLGDEAALCAGLWVRKGKMYFAVHPGVHTIHTTSEGSAAPLPWPEILPRLAKLVVARLP